MSFMEPQFEYVSTRVADDELFVCADCYQFINNGEVENPDPSWKPEDCDYEDIYYIGDSDRDVEFSRSPCDCCGSNLHGFRGHCVRMESGDFVQWRLSAPGYLDCTDWYEADSILGAVADMLDIYGDGFDLDDLQSITSELPGDFDSFWRGYLLALAFTANHYESEDAADSLFSNPGGDISDVVDIDEFAAMLSDETRLGLYNDCLGFYLDAYTLLPEGFDRWDYLGSDFHLTRNSHGAGFWDGHIFRDIGGKLTELARPYGTSELEVCGDKENPENWHVHG